MRAIDTWRTALILPVRVPGHYASRGACIRLRAKSPPPDPGDLPPAAWRAWESEAPGRPCPLPGRSTPARRRNARKNLTSASIALGTAQLSYLTGIEKRTEACH